MNSNLLMNFSVDKENKQIVVNREFAADPAKVWKAWTTPEILDQWWAPKPWKAKTKSMDFTEGGFWLYAMVGPEGEEHWAKADYQTIFQEQKFTGLDCFCDSEGTINTSMPRTKWEVSFAGNGEHTNVNIVMSFNELSDLETTIQMGFKEGFLSAMENLDQLL